MAELPRVATISIPSPEAAQVPLDHEHLLSQAHGPGEACELTVLPVSHLEVDKIDLPVGRPLWIASAVKFWKLYINPELTCQDTSGLTIHDPRDFLALERTHLAYVRTGNALALFGVTMAQLFILNDAGSVYGKTLASCAYALAILISISSAFRVILVQHKLVAHRILTATRLFCLVAALTAALLLVVLVVNLLI